jgi:hypothetical protein
LPSPTSDSLFPTVRWSSFAAGPRSRLKDRVHPLLSSTSPSEFVAASHLPDTRKYRTPPLGFPSPSRHQHVESTRRRVSAPDYGPPSAFLTLSTGCSSTRLAGLFHPAATSEIRTSGSFPAAQPTRLIDAPCPLVIDEILLPASCPTGTRSTRPVCRALIQAAIRCGQQGV